MQPQLLRSALNYSTAAAAVTTNMLLAESTLHKQ